MSSKALKKIIVTLFIFVIIGIIVNVCLLGLVINKKQSQIVLNNLESSNSEAVLNNLEDSNNEDYYSSDNSISSNEYYSESSYDSDVPLEDAIIGKWGGYEKPYQNYSVEFGADGSFSLLGYCYSPGNSWNYFYNGSYTLSGDSATIELESYSYSKNGYFNDYLDYGVGAISGIKISGNKLTFLFYDPKAGYYHSYSLTKEETE